MLLRRLARPLLATVFVVEGVQTLRHPENRTKAANELVQRGQTRLPDQYAAKLPADSGTIVQATAAAQVAGGVLLAWGKAPRIAAVVLAATVVPSTVTEQDFWNEPDPDKKAAKRTGFLKDLGLLGGLMIASADTEGKPSLGWRGRRAARQTATAVSTALPFGATAEGTTGDALRKHAQVAAGRAGALGSAAASRGSELAGTVQLHGPDWAETAKDRGSEWAGVALEQGGGLAEVAKKRGTELAEAAKQRGPGWAEAAKERGTELAEAAKQRGPGWAEAAKERGTELAEAAKHQGPGWAEAAKERGAGLAGVAKERGTEWAEVAKHRGPGWAEAAKGRGAEFAEAARHRGAELADVAKHRGAEFAEVAKDRGGELAETARHRVEARRR